VFEILDGQGLGEMRVEPGLQRLLAVSILAVPGVGDEPDRPSTRLRAQAPGHLVSGDVGQSKVTEYEVETLLVGGGQPVVTGVNDRHLMASAFQ
jgi:hypothetical protein